jgi:hypothetical protein
VISEIFKPLLPKYRYFMIVHFCQRKGRSSSQGISAVLQLKL